MRHIYLGRYHCIDKLSILWCFTVPDAPASAGLSVVDGETLLLNWTAPLSDGGAAVQSYRVSQHD